MIKTIKVKKEMIFLQLIEAASRYKLHDGGYREYLSDCMRYVVRLSPEELDYVKDIKVENHLGYYPNIPYDTIFTVEVEEPITEDTRMAKIVILTKDGVIHRSWNDSINGLKTAYPDASQIHTLINGKLQLIWERDSDD